MIPAAGGRDIIRVMRRRWTFVLAFAALVAPLAVFAFFNGWGSRPAAATTYYAFAHRESRTPGAGVRADLYLPPRSGARPPLVIVLPGGLRESPDLNDVLGPAAADALVRRGLAVALVGFTLAEDYRLPACVDDVAAVVREVVARADSLDCDAAHPALLGHGLGAWMASMLALDERLSAAASLDVHRPRGVIAMRGSYDVSDKALAGREPEAFFAWAYRDDARLRASASPIARARADAPPFLILSGGDDAAEWSRGARDFARALERAGAPSVDRYVVLGRNASGLLNLGGVSNDLGDLVATFAAKGSTPLPVDGPWGVRRIWSRNPPLSSEPLRRDSRAIEARPVDDSLRIMLARVFRDSMPELDAWPLEHYDAIDLGAYLASREAGEVGRGDFLTIANFRGEEVHLTRNEIAEHHPVLVVGLDDETNLFRLVSSYRLNRAYSWEPDDGPLPVMVRPVGAFLHFPAGAPAALQNRSFAPFGLLRSSFHWTEKDPLAAVRDLPDDVERALTGEEGCLTCHAFRGAGARAHHVTAARGEPHGAVALGLEEYPPAVLWRFLMDQDDLAASFNVSPLHVDYGAAQGLYDVVARERKD